MTKTDFPAVIPLLTQEIREIDHKTTLIQWQEARIYQHWTIDSSCFSTATERYPSRITFLFMAVWDAISKHHHRVPSWPWYYPDGRLYQRLADFGYSQIRAWAALDYLQKKSILVVISACWLCGWILWNEKYSSPAKCLPEQYFPSRVSYFGGHGRGDWTRILHNDEEGSRLLRIAA